MQRFLNCGYSKSVDGPAPARSIRTPPEGLRIVFERFMADPTG
ncbi:hypothetical protein [Streptacidiphilus sp. EB129]